MRQASDEMTRRRSASATISVVVLAARSARDVVVEHGTAFAAREYTRNPTDMSDIVLERRRGLHTDVFTLPTVQQFELAARSEK
jgi:hypothetical protein